MPVFRQIDQHPMLHRQPQSAVTLAPQQHMDFLAGTGMPKVLGGNDSNWVPSNRTSMEGFAAHR